MIEAFAKAASEVGKEASKETGSGLKNFDTRKKVDGSDSKVDNIKTADNKKAIDIDKRKPIDKNDNKPLSNEKIEKLQNERIAEAEKTPDLNTLDSQAKGNYAEMKVDRDLAGKGYERISKECVTDLKTPTGPGIDGVFVDKETGKTLITETKFNKSELGDTLDGKQMSSAWIDKRLDAAVGKEMADKIRLDSIIDPDSVQSILAKVDLNCEVTYFRLDSAANIIGGIEL